MRYGDYAPTGFDHRGAFLPDRQDWLVMPVGRTRDDEDEPYIASNWEAALDLMGGESDTVEIHRFGHWGPGWFELILVAPSRASEVDTITRSLEDYPLLDEDRHSELEFEAICERWADSSMGERIAYCAEYGASVFAARRANPFDVEAAAGDWPYVLIQR